MSSLLSVENLSKSYQLGQIGTGRLVDDLKVWWAKKHGLPNPLLRIVETRELVLGVQVIHGYDQTHADDQDHNRLDGGWPFANVAEVELVELAEFHCLGSQSGS